MSVDSTEPRFLLDLADDQGRRVSVPGREKTMRRKWTTFDLIIAYCLHCLLFGLLLWYAFRDAGRILDPPHGDRLGDRIWNEVKMWLDRTYLISASFLVRRMLSGLRGDAQPVHRQRLLALTSKFSLWDSCNA